MVATMPEPKSKSEDAGAETEPKSTLNVAPETRALLGKIANLRGKTMRQFFLERDVETFFSHLYEEELKKEQQKLKGKR